MPRTTLNLDPSAIGELRRRSKRERKSIGELAASCSLADFAKATEGSTGSFP